LRIPPLASCLVPKVIELLVPDGLEFLNHVGLTQRNPDVINNEISEMEVLEVEV